jgi:hypothetical protein
MHKYGTILAIMLLGLSVAVSIGSAGDEDYTAASDAAVDKAGTSCEAAGSVTPAVQNTPLNDLMTLGGGYNPPPALCPDTSSSGELYAGESVTLNAAPCTPSLYKYTWVKFIDGSQTNMDTDCDMVLTVPPNTPVGTPVGGKVTIENKYNDACMDVACIKYTVKALPCCVYPDSYCKGDANSATVASFTYSMPAGYTAKAVIDGTVQHPVTVPFLNGLTAGMWHTVSWNIYKGTSTTPFRTGVCSQSFFVYSNPVASITPA